MRLPWNLVFTVFDLFESRMLWVKNCHDTISLQCKRKFDHHGIFQISPPEHCDRGFHKKVSTSAAKCGMPKDKMQRNATEWCPILSYFALFCHIMLRFVALCQILSLFTQGGDLLNLEFGQILSTSFWRMKVLKIIEISENLLWNRWNFWANFWDQWKFSAIFSDRWTFWANFSDQWKFWANFWGRSDFVDKFLDRWKFW